jgi:hypothetical protein
MGKAITVDGCTFKYTITVVPPIYSIDDPTDGAITSDPSETCTAGGSACFMGDVDFEGTIMAPDSSQGGTVSPTQDTASGKINATALKAKVDNKAVLRVGDKSLVPMVLQFSDVNSSIPMTIPIAVTIIVEVDDPGQDKAEAS